jgi:SAM-dependent methyltransferase
LNQKVTTLKMETNLFKIDVYDDRYFKWHFDVTRNYAIKTMNWFIQEYKPNSIIDYGCGIGAYLESGLKNNLTKLRGFDIGGDNLIPYIDSSVKEYIEFLDCTQPLKTEKYDCVISLETGEHIEPSQSDSFVDNICNSLNSLGLILFSAAPPGQGGSGHINCQPKSFWIEKFEQRGVYKNEDKTKTIVDEWGKLGAPNYICSNLIVLEKK